MPSVSLKSLARFLQVVLFVAIVTPPARSSTRVEEFLAMRRLVGEGRFDEAIARCNDLIPRYPDDVPLYESLAEVSLYAGRLNDAQAFFIKRAEYGEELGLAYFGLGEVSFAKEDFRAALYSYSRAIDVGLNVPEVYNKLEYAYEKTDGVESAIEMFDGLCHRQPDNANYWYAAALAYWSRGDWGKVLECADEACRRQPFEPKMQEAKATCLVLMHPSATPRNVETLIELATRRGDIQGALFLSGAMLQSLRARSENKQLAEMLARFENTARAYGYLRLLAYALSERGSAQYYNGSLTSAEATYLDAYAQARTVKDGNQMLSICVQRCPHLLLMGEYSRVAEQALNCLYASEMNGAVSRRIDALGLLSLACGETGDSRLSLRYAVEASTASRGTSPESFSRVFAAQVLAGAYLQNGNHDRAMRAILPALTKSRQSGLHTSPIFAGLLGVAKALSGDLRSAHGEFEHQVNWAKALNFLHEEMLGRLHIAELEFMEGRHAQAMKRVDEVLSSGTASELATIRILAYRLKAAVAEGMHDTATALRSSIEAFNLVLGLRSFDAAVGIGISRTLTLRNDLERIVSLLCRMGRHKEALDYFNKFMIYRFQVLSVVPEIPESDEARVVEFPGDVWREGTQSGVRWSSRSAETNSRNLWVNVATPDRRERHVAKPEFRPPLERDEAQLAYFVGEEKTHLFACRHDSVSHFTIRARRGELERMMTEMSVVLGKNGPRMPILNDQTAGFSRRDAGRLYDILVRPAEPLLEGCTRLVIVPDQPLNGLPFETLIKPLPQDTEEEPLIASYEISYAIAPALVESHQMFQDQETHAIVILGDPASGSRQDRTGYGDLALRATPDTRNELSEFPGIRREVERISEILGGDCSVVLGTQASRNAIFTLPSTLRLLHIAAHVDWRPNDRRRSFIRLAPSGAEENVSGLRVDEIRKLSLSAEMVVLSGCNTARPWPDEGAESISRAFVFAGASSVVGSLWGVDDGTTAYFMESFYRHLLRGESRSSALRDAKLEMIRAGRSDPFYWGAFVLIGDRGTIGLPSKAANPKPLELFILLAVISLFLTGVLLRVRFLRSRS